MPAGTPDMAQQPSAPADMRVSGERLRRWWSAAAIAIATALFMQAILAGAVLTGIDFALEAHKMAAGILVASVLAASLAALFTLRRIANGLKFALTLLALLAAIVVQTLAGKLSMEGANLMWLHVPLGVALVGLATQAVAGARRLGGN